MGIPLVGTSNAGGVGENCDSRRISRYHIEYCSACSTSAGLPCSSV